MRRTFLISLITVWPMMGQTQRFTFGVTGGTASQTPLGRTESGTPFALGFTTNIRLSSRFSLETGLLVHRMGQQFNNGVILYPENSVTQFYSEQHGSALEIPILAKYHLRGERSSWRPFLVAGPTVRRTSLRESDSSGILSGTNLSTFQFQSSFNGSTVKWNLDPALGGGIDLKAGRFHLEPQARYSYWGAGKNTLVRKDQVDFLLGFRF